MRLDEAKNILNKNGYLLEDKGPTNIVHDFSRDSLGVSFIGKFGTMRKENKWVIYDESFKDNGKIYIQGNGRFGEIVLDTGVLTLSAKHGDFANTMSLWIDIRNGNAQTIQLDKDITNQFIDAVSNRRITDHRFDNIIRNADVTDEEIAGLV